MSRIKSPRNKCYICGAPANETVTTQTIPDRVELQAPVCDDCKQKMMEGHNMTRGEILQSAINKWGADAQMGVLIEECAELIQAVSKIKRGEGARDDWDNFAEELADVQIMIDQMRLIVGPGTVDNWEERKLSRLERRLGTTEGGDTP